MEIPLLCMVLVAPFAFVGFMVAFIHSMAFFERITNKWRRKRWIRSMMNND